MDLYAAAVRFPVAGQEEIERIESHILDGDRIAEIDHERSLGKPVFGHLIAFLRIYIGGTRRAVGVFTDVQELQHRRLLDVIRRVERDQLRFGSVFAVVGFDLVDLAALDALHRKTQIVGNGTADRLHTDADQHRIDLVLVLHVELDLVVDDEIVEIKVAVSGPEVLEHQRAPSVPAGGDVDQPLIDAGFVVITDSGADAARRFRIERAESAVGSHGNGHLRRNAAFGPAAHIERPRRGRHVELHRIGVAADHKRSERLGPLLGSHIYAGGLRSGEITGDRSRRFPTERGRDAHLREFSGIVCRSGSRRIFGTPCKAQCSGGEKENFFHNSKSRIIR